MLFNSLEFFIFFPVVTLLYFLLPHRFRWAMLLGASCLFYMAFIPYYLLLLLTLIVVDYAAGIMLEKPERSQRARKNILLASIISVCLVLGVFKYFNFFNSNVEALAKMLGWNYSIGMLKLALPVGLSFHTFQSLSYVIEVYRKKQKAERHFGIYALYVMFYPQLVAGPIERPQNLLHQFHEKHVFNRPDVIIGLRLMLWGMFKKTVIADRLAGPVSHVYSNVYDYHGIPLLLVTALFAIQVFCDFSGYSDIAIGAARVMGFRLMNNFNRPFFSTSMTEFWRRWHISLSTWFRDYIFQPMTPVRAGKGRITFGLMVTFLLSGLWHGAGWNFIVFGGLSGLYLVTDLWTDGIRRRFVAAIGPGLPSTLHRIFQMLLTFMLYSFSMIFFRASSLREGLYVAGHLFSGLNTGYSDIGIARPDIPILILGIAVMEGVHVLQETGLSERLISASSRWQRWACYYGLILAILFFGVFEKRQFIYFQF
jgi:alginate O-acetyltransferase complex protein AlgI